LCPEAQPCDQTLESDCIIYNGNDYECANITSGMTISEVIKVVINSLNLNCTTTTSTTTTTTSTTSTTSTTTTTTAFPGRNGCSSIPLTVNCNCIYQLFDTSQYSNFFNPPAPSCNPSGYLGGDIWFNVVVPASGQLFISTSALQITDAAFSVYSGGCLNLNEIICVDDNQGLLMPATTLTGLNPGDTLIIRFWGYGGSITGQVGTFEICVSDPSCCEPVTITGSADACITTTTSTTTSTTSTSTTTTTTTATPDCAIGGNAFQITANKLCLWPRSSGGIYTCLHACIEGAAAINGGECINYYVASNCTGAGCDVYLDQGLTVQIDSAYDGLYSDGISCYEFANGSISSISSCSSQTTQGELVVIMETSLNSQITSISGSWYTLDVPLPYNHIGINPQNWWTGSVTGALSGNLFVGVQTLSGDFPLSLILRVWSGSVTTPTNYCVTVPSISGNQIINIPGVTINSGDDVELFFGSSTC
jgi:hypothetical protein